MFGQLFRAGFWVISLSGFPFLSCFSQLNVQLFRNPEISIPGAFIKKDGGIDLKRLQYFGNRDAVGFFQSAIPAFGVENGIVLSTGIAIAIATPNRSGNTGASMGIGGDPDLSRIARGRTFDTALLLIDFVPQTDTIAFEYIFGSEEYPEFVDKGVNDLFAFLVRKKGSSEWTNIAITPTGIPVTVDQINHLRNTGFFVSNSRFTHQEMHALDENDEKLYLAKYFTFDGFTLRLRAGTKVDPFELYEMKIAIADVGDDVYDSGVFLAANSFQAVNYVPESKKENTPWTTKHENVEIVKDSQLIVYRLYFNFAFDSCTLSESDRLILKDLTSSLIGEKGKISVFGHTDKVGNVEYNYELSLKRAQTVANELISYGLDRNRLTVKGFGDTKPLHSNSDDEGRKKNRRVEIVID